jgi:hypothetical protein
MRSRLLRWKIPPQVRAREAFLLPIKLFSDLGCFALIQQSWSRIGAAVPQASHERPPGTYVGGAHYRVHHPHTAQESKLTGYHTEGGWLQIRDDAHEKKDGGSGQTHLTALGKDIEATSIGFVGLASDLHVVKNSANAVKPHRVQYAVSAALRTHL